jgi:hypothetical protein
MEEESGDYERKEAQLSYMLQHNEDSSSEIVMNGNLVYRYSTDQIELEGTWSINNDVTSERFSYLFLKKSDKIECGLKRREVIWDAEPTRENFPSSRSSKNDFTVNICSSNLFECILIPHQQVFAGILNYLCGEYHGFFMYYDKTIEDRFFINYKLDLNQVRLSGEGTNSLGNFNLIGYINFYTDKG